MGLIQDLQNLWWWRKEKRARQATMARAFADNRWVLDLTIQGRSALVRFTPRMDEAESFLDSFVLPFLKGQVGWFDHTGPWAADGSKTPLWAEFLQFSRITSVTITAKDQTQYDTLLSTLSRLLTETPVQREVLPPSNYERD